MILNSRDGCRERNGPGRSTYPLELDSSVSICFSSLAIHRSFADSFVCTTPTEIVNTTAPTNPRTSNSANPATPAISGKITISKTEESSASSSLSPEQRLEPPNLRLITAGIVTIHDMKTLRACIAYENAHQQRVQILQRLEHRASEIRSQED